MTCINWCYRSAVCTYHNDVMTSSSWEVVEPTGEVGLGAEVLGRRRVKSEQFFHVEDLYAVVDTLFRAVSSRRSTTDEDIIPDPINM